MNRILLLAVFALSLVGCSTVSRLTGVATLPSEVAEGPPNALYAAVVPDKARVTPEEFDRLPVKIIDENGGVFEEFPSTEISPKFGAIYSFIAVNAKGRRVYVDGVNARKIEDPKVDYIGPFSEGLAPARRGPAGPCGYADENGNWKIEPDFDGCGAFRDGFAQVSRPTQRNTPFKTVAFIGLIDRSGTAVVPFGALKVASVSAHQIAFCCGMKFNPLIYDTREKKSTPLPELDGVIDVNADAALIKLDHGLMYAAAGKQPVPYPSKPSKPAGLLGPNVAYTFADYRLEIYAPDGKLLKTVDNVMGFSSSYLGYARVSDRYEKVGFMSPDGTWAQRPIFTRVLSFDHGWTAAESFGWAMVDPSGKAMFKIEGNLVNYSSRLVTAKHHAVEEGSNRVIGSRYGIWNRAGRRIADYVVLNPAAQR